MMWLLHQVAGRIGGVIVSLALCSATPLADADGPLAERPDVETASDRYRSRFHSAIGRWFLQQQTEALLKLLEPWKGATVLDVGGGHGQYTADLVREGYSVTVLGSGPGADRQIRHLVEQEYCRYVEGSLVDLPFPDRSFDVVISFRLMSHLSAWQAFIGEVSRVARRAVIVDFPVLTSFNRFYSLFFRVKQALENNSTRPFTVFPERVVNRTFAEYGFHPTGRCAQYFLPMVLHRTFGSVAFSTRIEQMFRLFGLTDRFGSPVVARYER